MRRLIGSLTAVVLAAAVPVSASWFASDVETRVRAWLVTPAEIAEPLPATFEVKRGLGARTIARALEQRGLLRGADAFVAYLRASGVAQRLHAGEYVIEESPTPASLAALLVSGRVLLHRITIPEGLTLEETIAVLAGSGLWAPEELEDAFRDPTAVADLDPSATDLEGYLFPETYHFASGTPPATVARAFVDRFRAVFEPMGDEASALTTREVVTLASLVESETAMPQEYRLVASVFHNRLRKGMKLECDPTVIRAMQIDGAWPGGQLLRQHLAHDSPYNTYAYPGLPPGPICSPGGGALQAAVDPAESRLIFFVASGDGGHHFAETLGQHERNVRKWRQYQRDNGLR